MTAFAEHFGRRRVELGDCVRPYGTGCSHEHACIRCDYLHVDASQATRLDTIERDLNTRVEQAEKQQWLADVDQLRITLDHLKTKRTQLTSILAGPPLDTLTAASAALTVPEPHDPADASQEREGRSDPGSLCASAGLTN